MTAEQSDRGQRSSLGVTSRAVVTHLESRRHGPAGSIPEAPGTVDASEPLESAGLSLPQSTALVMGSIIGVGIFSLPYAIASYGPISLVAMALATIGAVALAFMFAVLSRRIPADGGPYAYARAAF